MSMKKVSIITRAFNRLEYTIQCVKAVKENTHYFNYEHIIINNNSQDGTKEWGKWINQHTKHYYNKVRFVNLDYNSGDWGGMVIGYQQRKEDSHYIVQLDNDVIPHEGWLTKMVHFLDNTEAKIVMAKRYGTRHILNPKKQYWRDVKGVQYHYGKIGRPVACFLLTTADFKNTLQRTQNKNTQKAKTLLSALLNKTFKLFEVGCTVLEGWENDFKPVLNHVKYPKINPSIYNKK